jgi:hypothetical protein
VVGSDMFADAVYFVIHACQIGYGGFVLSSELAYIYVIRTVIRTRLAGMLSRTGVAV